MPELVGRDFLRGLLAVAAPAIVHSANIMPVKALTDEIVKAITVTGVDQYGDALVESFAMTKEIVAANVMNTRQLGLPLSLIRDLLMPGLRQITGTYKAWPQIDWSAFDEAG